MEAYDPSVIESAFHTSRTAFAALADRLADPAADRLDHAALEKVITCQGREVLRLLLQDLLDLRAARERERLAHDRLPAPVDAQGTAHRAVETGHTRQLATVVGRVTVRRAAHRARGSANLYPADAALNLPAGLHSFGVRRHCAEEAVRGSFDAAIAAITTACGPVVAKRQARQLVRAAAADVAAFYTHAQTAPPSTDATLLVLSFDGKGVPMLPEGLREETRKKTEATGRGPYRTRLASGQKSARKRMAAIAAVYDATPAIRRPHDVIQLAGAERAARRKGPKAQRKWLTASLTRPARQVIAEAFDRAEERDPAHRRTWVVLVDGDNHQIELIQAEAGRRGASIHLVIDFVHVAEYLWRAAWCFYSSGEPEAERWVGIQLLGILSGKLAETLGEIHQRARTAKLTDDQVHSITQCTRYLKAKEPFLDYAGALAAGWPIATGIVEGACRHLIADRMDITGARWGLEDAEAVLTLRAVQSNGDFQEYWAWHEQQEYMRNHQARYQEGYCLTA